MSYEDPVSQRSMVLDHWRNGFYERALAAVVNPATVVLDVGSGLGILGFLAAKLGARKVYMVEPETNLEAARLIARDNNLLDRIEFYHKKLELAQLPEKADVITSVFTGNFLLEEDLLPILFKARDRYLKPGGVLLPGRGRMFIAAASVPDYHEKVIGCWRDTGSSVDQSAIQRFAVNRVYYEDFSRQQCTLLSSQALLVDMNFYSSEEARCDAIANLEIIQGGELHGLIGWFDMLLHEEWLSTSPQARATHWSQAYLPVDPVMTVKEGDQLIVSLHRPEYGEWSWKIRCGTTVATHSTFLSKPFTPNDLSRRSAEFAPTLSSEGQASAFLLARFDGLLTAAELASAVLARFPDLFSGEADALRFVVRHIERFSE